MKRRSIFWKIVSGFLLVYTVYSVGFFVYYVDRSYTELTKRSFVSASNYIKIGRLLLRYGEVSDLANRLQIAVESSDIDYYLIREGAEQLAYGNAAGAGDPLLFVEGGPEGIYETESYRHFLAKEGEYELVIGHKISKSAYLKLFFDQDRSLIIKDLILVSLFVFGLVFYHFRDIRAILSRLSQRGGRKGNLSLAKSKEGLTLARGLSAFEDRVASLAVENSVLRSEILPALRKEIYSGRTPPYEFGCALVRTDINNFTSIFTSQDRSTFMGVINEFFVGVTHIVSRYGGFVYEFIGDEVIYYFRDEDHVNASATAISALRDINAWADKLSERTSSELGYAIKIKSSLASGMLRFGPLVDGHSLAGSPLIETVRILSHIQERDRNTVVFGTSVKNQIGDLCLVNELKVVMLKGLSEARHLYSYGAHVPLTYYLRQGNEQSLQRVQYYRSDEHIAEILKFITENRDGEKNELTMSLFTQFRSYRVTMSSSEVRASYLNLLEVLQSEAEQVINRHVAQFHLATAIMAGFSLIPPGTLSGELRNSLLRCLKSNDRRVVANTIDLFSELDPEAGEEIFNRVVDHSDNRVVANALVKEAKRNWSKKIGKRLRAMLKANSPYFKASALFALGEISDHLREVDEVAFQTNTELQSLLAGVPNLSIHANRMVRRQAMRTLCKSKKLSELYQIERSHQHLMSSDMKVEVRNFLSQYEKNDDVRAGSTGLKIAS